MHTGGGGRWGVGGIWVQGKGLDLGTGLALILPVTQAGVRGWGARLALVLPVTQAGVRGWL